MWAWFDSILPFCLMSLVHITLFTVVCASGCVGCGRYGYRERIEGLSVIHVCYFAIGFCCFLAWNWTVGFWLNCYISKVPSVLWRCWLGGRKGIRPVKNSSGGVLAWLSVWSEMQTCMWPSWCHCHSLAVAAVKSRLVLPFWYWLTRVVPEKGPLNGCVCAISRNTSLQCFDAVGSAAGRTFGL